MKCVHTLRLALDGVSSSLTENGGINSEGTREGDSSSGELHDEIVVLKNGRSLSSSAKRMTELELIQRTNV